MWVYLSGKTRQGQIINLDYCNTIWLEDNKIQIFEAKNNYPFVHIEYETFSRAHSNFAELAKAIQTGSQLHVLPIEEDDSKYKAKFGDDA